MSETIIETNRTDGIKAINLYLTERETTLLNKNNEPCDDAYNEFDPKERLKKFQQCCKDSIWSHVSQKINCTVPGYEEVSGESLSVPECTESQAAAHSNNQVICYNYYNIFMHHIKRLPMYIH
jgi:hypothetical protein